MANEQNLRPRRELSTEEAKRMGSAGGKASVAARKEIKLIKQAIAERMGADDFNEIIDNMIKRAKEQDKSFEVWRDSLGQKPVEKTETTLIGNVDIAIGFDEDEQQQD